VDVNWRFSTDQAYTRDGFFMDNVKVTYLGSAPTSISDWNEYSIQVYPNPANNILRVQTEQDERIDYQIVDQLGRILNKGELIDHAISLEQIPSGHYILQLLNEKGQKSIKFQVIR